MSFHKMLVLAVAMLAISRRGHVIPTKTPQRPPL